MFVSIVYAFLIKTATEKQLSAIFHDLAELAETDVNLKIDVMYKELKRHWNYLKHFHDDTVDERKDDLLLAIGDFQQNYYSNGSEILYDDRL